MAETVICWDLDETLGFFRPVANELLANAAARGDLGVSRRLEALVGEFLGARPAPAPLRLREGIADLLAAVRERGIRQVVTTGAFREYALLGLEKAGLAPLFDAVFSREALWDELAGGKRYTPVLERFAVGADRILIIGDDFKKDRASDHMDAVMICDQDGLDHPAAMLLPVIEALTAAESVGAGFVSLLASARPHPGGATVERGGVTASIGYWGNYTRGERTPVVSALRWSRAQNG
ncbi:MAG TPA: HAD family hydrolase [Planctomycetota bacterium]|nr:HAD family hydrolase [Planctomycetota bacterium]